MSTNQRRTVTHRLRAFAADEGGMETVQVVMVLGVAAVVLVVAWNLFPEVRDRTQKLFGAFKFMK